MSLPRPLPVSGSLSRAPRLARARRGHRSGRGPVRGPAGIQGSTFCQSPGAHAARVRVLGSSAPDIHPPRAVDPPALPRGALRAPCPGASRGRPARSARAGGAHRFPAGAPSRIATTRVGGRSRRRGWRARWWPAGSSLAFGSSLRRRAHCARPLPRVPAARAGGPAAVQVRQVEGVQGGVGRVEGQAAHRGCAAGVHRRLQGTSFPAGPPSDTKPRLLFRESKE